MAAQRVAHRPKRSRAASNDLKLHCSSPTGSSVPEAATTVLGLRLYLFRVLVSNRQLQPHSARVRRSPIIVHGNARIRAIHVSSDVATALDFRNCNPVDLIHCGTLRAPRTMMPPEICICRMHTSLTRA
jgi:hypothetical protein